MTVYEFVAICKQVEDAGFADIHMDLAFVSEYNSIEEVAELTGNWTLRVEGEKIQLGFETIANHTNC